MKRLRADGYLPRRLSDDLEVAISQADDLNGKAAKTTLVAWNEPLTPRSKPSDVILAYKVDPAFTTKAQKTQRLYKQCMEQLDSWAGDQPIGTICRGNIIDLHRTLYDRKPAFANAIGRMARIVFEFVVTSEATGTRYKADHFRHLFKEVADKASWKDIQFRDLRP